MDAIERWVQEAFAPVVLTFSTPEVDRIAQKNALSFADLLNGFAALSEVDVPVRSVSHAIRLTSFNYRFLPARQFGTLPIADATRHLNESVARHPPKGGTVVDLQIPHVKTVEDVPVYLRAIGAETDNSEPFSWYREFKLTLMDTFRCEEASMMCHPAAMLVVVSSTDANPRQSFQELASPQNLPPPFMQGLYDPALVPKFYVVLHDASETEGTSIDPEAILRSLNIAEGTGAVVRVNSIMNAPPDPATAAAISAIWSAHPYVRPALFPAAETSMSSDTVGYFGSSLSEKDIAGLHAFVRDFGLRFVLSAMESRIFQLNDIVSAMKKGVKNVFKSWLRKPKDLSRPNSLNGNGGAGGNGAIAYRYDSIEAQTRLLADTAFLVRDYELALQMYRLARDDFKSDKSLFHCANANEMIALCLLLNRGSPMQITNALDSANAVYAKVNNLVASRLAVRTAVIAGEIYNALSHMGLFTDYMDNASAALIRGSTMEQGICSAVLMERAALCDLHARQPKFRKYGFRMVMAGHIYDSLGHSPHSARCYSLARAIYDCSGWFQVEDHINFTLAQQANRLNDPMASINLFLKLIGTGRNSASQQEALLYEFGLIVKEILLTATSDGASNSIRSGTVSVFQDERGENKLLVKDLRMPELDDKSTVVFAPGNAVGIDRSIDGNESDADTWKQLEELVDKQNRLHQYATSNDTVSNPDKSATRWFAPAHFYAAPYRNKRNAVKVPVNYALGEQIYVEFVMKNALSCAVDVEGIHLFGKFEPLDGGDVVTIPEPKKRADGNDENAEGAVEAVGSERVAVASVNLQLLPVSEERVRLAICPKVPGKLTIVGVQWSICGGDVHGEHAFDIPGPLLQDTRAHKEARARAPNTSLIANVVGEMPWLGVEIDCNSSDVFVGEVVEMRVAVVNAGSAAVTGLQCSSKALMLCASVSSPDAPPIGYEHAGYIGASGQVVDLSAVTLQPGEKKVFTLWARAMTSGRQQAPLLFQYSGPTAGNAGMTESRSMASSPLKRVVKVKVALNVLPCLDVAYSVEPSLARNGEFILGVSVANQRTDGMDASGMSSNSVQLEQLLCVSKYWTVEKFAAPKLSTMGGIMPDAARLRYQEASTSYFRLKPREASTASDYQPLVVSLASDSSFGQEEIVAKLPLEQFLCLDHALGMVKAASAGDADGSGGDTKGGAGPNGGGLRSIQSVRRENKALKATQDSSTPGGEANDTMVQLQPTTKEALVSARNVDGHLVLVWSAACGSTDAGSERRAVGQTNFTGIQVRAPLQPQSCTLNVSLEYADSISLQPASSNGIYFAQLDFVMHISSTSSIDSPPIDFIVELLHPEEAAPTPAGENASAALFAGGLKPASARHGLPFSVPLSRNAIPHRSSSPHFFWTGVTKKTIYQFAPTARTSIRMSACFVAPGVYNLNRFRVVMLPSQGAKGGAAAAFAFPADHLVFVNPPRLSEATNPCEQATAAGIPEAETLVAVP